MAHELAFTNGKANIAYTKSGGLPWHGLGVPCGDDETPESMGKKAGALYPVEKQALFREVGGKRFKSSKMSLVRTDTNFELDVVGEGWEPCQNLTALKFFDEFVKAGDMHMETVGVLKEGRMMWALAKVKESFTILKKDRIDSYLLFANPHQFGKGISTRFTPTRVVCNNTITIALEEGSVNSASFNHASKFDPEIAKRTLGISSKMLAAYKAQAELLAKSKAKTEDVVTYFKRVFKLADAKPKKDGEDRQSPVLERLEELLHTQPGADLGAGTWWQPFNCATFYVDHEAGRSDDSRLYSAWFGGNEQRKQRALRVALEMAKA